MIIAMSNNTHTQWHTGYTQ